MSVLEQEIYEQPIAIARLLETTRDAVEKLAAAIREREVCYLMIAARGSSDHAAAYAQYLFAAYNGLPVALATPSLYTIYRRPPRLRHVLVLGISQSGQSVDIVEVVQEARRQGALTAAITNDSASPLAQAAEFVLDLNAGEEKAVAATKTYTASLTMLALLSAALERDEERLACLAQLPQNITRTLELAAEAVERQAERYRYMEDCVVIGRGLNYATAFEIALKLKELTYVVAVPYSSADFLHGPMAIVEPGFPVLVVAPDGEMFPDMLAFLKQLNGRAAEILAISNRMEALELAKTALPLPTGIPEWLSPITAVIPGQLLALHLALAKGLDPDAPRGLRKVTVTR
ncbi:MAG: SIS domain-containing protein [Anaerolineae bacterium]|nr:SIS domain-containing protein [Anaerolineae bacterium]MDW8100073.1 SIS domain-containing protein [Anaerolineae bacterium]